MAVPNSILLLRQGLPVPPAMINMQDFNTVLANSVYDQIRRQLYNPLTRAGKVSVTTDKWIVSQGLVASHIRCAMTSAA